MWFINGSSGLDGLLVDWVGWFINGSSGLDGLLVDWVGWFINGFVSSNICGNTKGVANNGNYL
jgi:hypothetical protein